MTSIIFVFVLLIISIYSVPDYLLLLYILTYTTQHKEYLKCSKNLLKIKCIKLKKDIVYYIIL
jgi:hypothetical protein